MMMALIALGENIGWLAKEKNPYEGHMGVLKVHGGFFGASNETETVKPLYDFF